mmetsp:Transcript_627/g.1811  ORF Transcript_627/g.1811 Transcript_627/m.1811 type:complete len:347 (-) Transcript_627:60-1100(-)
MNRWAAGGKYDCHFLCICVLGDRSAIPLAREMSQGSKLTHCVNAFVDNENDLPTYGQLGCQGFIILDSDLQVVTTGTSAFMQVRNLAFSHVEALLDAVCAHQPLPKFCPGETLQLVEPPPERPDLRGATGMCVAVKGTKIDFGFMAGPLRGRMMQVASTAVRRVDDDEEEEPGQANLGGCCDVKGDCDSGGCGTKGDCNSGGCGTNGDCVLDKEFVNASLDLVSVKVPSMDAEHGECAAAFRTLAESKSMGDLKALLQCLSEHFAHEEALFEEFGFGKNTNERFSARKTHIGDHNRILEKAQHALVAKESAPVPVGLIRELLQDFHDHTRLYDVQYADQLSAKGAK